MNRTRVPILQKNGPRLPERSQCTSSTVKPQAARSGCHPIGHTKALLIWATHIKTISNVCSRSNKTATAIDRGRRLTVFSAKLNALQAITIDARRTVNAHQQSLSEALLQLGEGVKRRGADACLRPSHDMDHHDARRRGCHCLVHGTWGVNSGGGCGRTRRGGRQGLKSGGSCAETSGKTDSMQWEKDTPCTKQETGDLKA